MRLDWARVPRRGRPEGAGESWEEEKATLAPKAVSDREPLEVGAEEGPTAQHKRHILPVVATPPTGEALRGLALVGASAFAFSLMSLLVKLAGRSLPSWELVFVRAFGNFVLNAIALAVTRRSPWGPAELRGTLVLRALAGFTGLSSIYFALTVLPLAEATTIAFTAPVWTGVLAHFVLRERWQRADIVATILALTGVVLVARPAFVFGEATSERDTEVADEQADASASYTPSRVFGLFVALFGSVCAAFAYMFVRKLGGRVNTFVVTHYFSTVATVLSPIFCFAFQRPVIPDTQDVALWFEMAGLGLTGFIGQVLLNKGLQMERAGPASAMRFLDIVFVFVWETTLLHVPPSPWSVAGAALVALCTIGIAYRKWSLSRAAPAAATPRPQAVGARRAQLGGLEGGAFVIASSDDDEDDEEGEEWGEGGDGSAWGDEEEEEEEEEGEGDVEAAEARENRVLTSPQGSR